jgi:hypothetical protein
MRGTTNLQVTILSILRSDSPIFAGHLIRRSVAPEQLLKTTVLVPLCPIRSERQFCEWLPHDLLPKFFLAPGSD